MRLFSSLKRFFSCDACKVDKRKIYTQEDVDAQYLYWKSQIENAKVIERKVCERAYAERLKQLQDEQNEKAQNICVTPKKKPKNSRKRSVVAGTADRIVDANTNRFIEECCIFDSKAQIPARLVNRLYQWWSKKNKLACYSTSRAIFTRVKHRGVAHFRKQQNHSKYEYIYRGMGMKLDFLDEYKASRTVHRVQSGNNLTNEKLT